MKLRISKFNLRVYLAVSLAVMLTAICVIWLTRAPSTTPSEPAGYAPLSTGAPKSPSAPEPEPKVANTKPDEKSSPITTKTESPQPPPGLGQRVEFSAKILAQGAPAVGAYLNARRIQKPRPPIPPLVMPFSGVIPSRSLQATASKSGSDGVARGTAYSYVGEPGETLYGIAAYHPEYGSAYVELPLEELKQVTVEDLVLELQRRHTIKGRVVDSAGNPLSGAHISLGTRWPKEGISMSGLSVRAKANGSFTMAGIGFQNTPTNLRVVYVPPRHRGRRIRQSPPPFPVYRTNAPLTDLFDENKDLTQVPDIQLQLNKDNTKDLPEGRQG